MNTNDEQKSDENISCNQDDEHLSEFMCEGAVQVSDQLAISAVAGKIEQTIEKKSIVLTVRLFLNQIHKVM